MGRGSSWWVQVVHVFLSRGAADSGAAASTLFADTRFPKLKQTMRKLLARLGELAELPASMWRPCQYPCRRRPLSVMRAVTDVRVSFGLSGVFVRVSSVRSRLVVWLWLCVCACASSQARRQLMPRRKARPRAWLRCRCGQFSCSCFRPRKTVMTQSCSDRGPHRRPWVRAAWRPNAISATYENSLRAIHLTARRVMELRFLLHAAGTTPRFLRSCAASARISASLLFTPRRSRRLCTARHSKAQHTTAHHTTPLISQRHASDAALSPSSPSLHLTLLNALASTMVSTPACCSSGACW
jgi:hypothetical protein